MGETLKNLNLIGMAILIAAIVGGMPVGAAEANRDTRWVSARGDWTDSAKWSGGVPDSLSVAWIGGESEVRVLKSDRPVAAGMMRIGTRAGDAVRLLIQRGELVSRREFIQVGEAAGSRAEIVLDEGALHGVSAFYLGGSDAGGCSGTLRIRGGSFVSRLVTMGWGQRSEAVLAIEGSRATAVHMLDYLTLGVPGAGGEPSTSTLSFTLDERGVTPVTIQSKRTGLRISRAVPTNRCRLQIALSAVPPRDDVTLVAGHVRTIGTFDDLPESAEITAKHGGREYRWTLTYRGGASGCDLALTKVRGHADDAVVAKCRAIPATPVPLWESMPARTSDDADSPPAFDGAEGFGRSAAGGRGGRTIPVTNLDDDGPGSFRAAATAKGPRTIEFHVGGTIKLKSSLIIRNPFLTVNGQSAPDGGITFSGNGFVVQTHDVILRHLHIRPGDGSHDTDALSFSDAERCIADHLSLCWGTDEVLSITGLSDSITVQWCVISESLNRDKHAYASIAAGERVTWHHNLFAHHVSRVPRFAGIARADFRNNVLYDWGHTAGYGQFERVNYVANYFKPGPSTTQRPPLIHAGEETVSDASLFLDGNIIEGHARANEDNWQAVGFDRRVRAERPFTAPPVHTTTAEQALADVLARAGATPDHRDRTDTRIIQQTRTRTGRIIDKVGDGGQ